MVIYIYNYSHHTFSIIIVGELKIKYYSGFIKPCINNYFLVIREIINRGLGGVRKIVARFKLRLKSVIHEIINSSRVIQVWV
jgi:hypothetical protein